MKFTELAWNIFNRSIQDFHTHDDVDATMPQHYEDGSLEHLLYSKNWIDTVQWHLEDIIRDENIAPEDALSLKRRIDTSNQKRTDLVEYIDSWFLAKYSNVKSQNNARINTETPAWAVDRLSILALKIFHMKLETERNSATEQHRDRCKEKLSILMEQQQDLTTSIEELLSEIENGTVRMKTYKQMKMYNDESLNPVLYQKSKNA